MKISIDREILKNFPEAKTGWLRASLKNGGTSLRVEAMKKSLKGRLEDIGLTAETVAAHPDIRRWRETFSKMGVKPSKYKSSIEALLRRVFKEELWSVSDVVDCYDCVSALNLLPMGAHDMAKLKGNMTLRYAEDGEKFYPLGAGDTVIECKAEQIVYADDEKICCWLWNHRDTREASVDADTKEALFIADCAFNTEWRSVEEGLAALAEELAAIGCTVKKYGVISAEAPEAETE